MKVEISDSQKPYAGNKAKWAVVDDLMVCAKCRHKIRRGEKYYRDVDTSKSAHITCRTRMATAKEEMAVSA
jgi:hypothetical protein